MLSIAHSCIALALLLLAGCGVTAGDLGRSAPQFFEDDAPIAEAYPDELEEALAAWRAEFGEPHGCDVGDLYVAWVKSSAECASVGKADGCLAEHESPLLPDTWTITVLDGADDSAVVAREARRWLAICSGVGLR